MKKAGKKKKKEFRFSTSFTMRFDAFTLEMLERIAYEEDKTRPEVIRASVKFLFLKKYGQEDLEKMRKKHRPDILKEW
ncbi:MAG TPA: hypothetical protein ENH31_04945 [Nitrospirae bacterium]|nr:hypothetical protein BMS3Abin10_01953 [bacterium BMS3Abin10]GBE38192.1 hypothetical protein BMS3Bbin08_00795 [bacterium BMS3Bbin08]HDK41061.1 hypothetical protein [Nitrospirota bacterium]HDK81901.1 hypothetical protein [Nitrospirota bacterium]